MTEPMVDERIYREVISRVEAGKVPLYPSIIRKKAITRYKVEKVAEMERARTETERKIAEERRRRAKAERNRRERWEKQQAALQKASEADKWKVHTGSWIKITKEGNVSGRGVAAMSPSEAKARGYKWGEGVPKEGGGYRFSSLPGEPTDAEYYGILEWKYKKGHYKRRPQVERQIRKEIELGGKEFGIAAPAWAGGYMKQYEAAAKTIKAAYRKAAESERKPTPAELKKAGAPPTPRPVTKHDVSKYHELATLGQHPDVQAHISAMQQLQTESERLQTRGTELQRQTKAQRELVAGADKAFEEYAKGGWTAEEAIRYGFLAGAIRGAGKELEPKLAKYREKAGAFETTLKGVPTSPTVKHFEAASKAFIEQYSPTQIAQIEKAMIVTFPDGKPPLPTKEPETVDALNLGFGGDAMQGARDYYSGLGVRGETTPKYTEVTTGFVAPTPYAPTKRDTRPSIFKRQIHPSIFGTPEKLLAAADIFDVPLRKGIRTTVKKGQEVVIKSAKKCQAGFIIGTEAWEKQISPVIEKITTIRQAEIEQQKGPYISSYLKLHPEATLKKAEESFNLSVLATTPTFIAKPQPYEEMIESTLPETAHTLIGGKKQKDIVKHEKAVSEAYNVSEALVKPEWKVTGETILPVKLTVAATTIQNKIKNLQAIGRSRGYERLDGSFEYPDTQVGKDWAKKYGDAINEQQKQVTAEGMYKKEYVKYTPAAQEYVTAYEDYETKQAKLEGLPKPHIVRQFGMGVGTLVAGLPGFIGFEMPRIAAKTIIKPTAAPGKLFEFGKGMKEFAKEKPVEFTGALFAMWGLGGFRVPGGRFAVQKAKMPSGAKSYSLGFLKTRKTGILGDPAYQEFYAGATLTYKLPKVITRKPLEFGKPLTTEAKLVTEFARTHEGYIAGSKGIYYQMPKNTVRVGVDHDIYFAGKTRAQISVLAKELQSQLGKKYEVKISKGGNSQIFNKATGKQVVDMLTRKAGQDKIVIKDGVPLRDYKQILRDKRQIVKHVSKKDPKHKKALFDIAKTEKAVKKGEYIIRTERGGISFRRYPIKSYEQLFGKEKGKWLPETPFETKIVRKISGVEEPLIVEARGTRFYTIKSKVAAKEVKSGIIEILEREKVPNKNKVANAIIKDLKKHNAELYGSLIQELSGKTIGKVGLNRIARDIDIHVTDTEIFANLVVQSINRAAGKKVIALKLDIHGNKTPTMIKSGEKLFDIHSKETPGYAYGEDFLGWGLSAEKMVKTKEGLKAITLSEQASRKFRGAVQVRSEPFYIIEGKNPKTGVLEIMLKPARLVERGITGITKEGFSIGAKVKEGTIIRKKGHLVPEHGGRFKDITDFYFAEKTNIAGLRIRHKLLDARKADAHLEKWTDSWGIEIARRVRESYQEATMKEGEKAFLGAFGKEPPILGVDTSSISISPYLSPSLMPSPSPLQSPNISPISKSLSASVSKMLSGSPSIPSMSMSPYLSPSLIPSISPSPSVFPSSSRSMMRSASALLSPSPSPISKSLSASVSKMLSGSPSIPSMSMSPYLSPSLIPSISPSPSPYLSPSPRISPSPYPSPSPTTFIEPPIIPPILLPPLSDKKKTKRKKRAKKDPYEWFVKHPIPTLEDMFGQPAHGKPRHRIVIPNGEDMMNRVLNEVPEGFE